MSPPKKDPIEPIKKRIDGYIQEIQQLLEKLKGFVQRILSMVNPFDDDHLGDAQNKLNEIVEKVGDFFIQTGNPIQLWEKADAWTNDIQKVVSPEAAKYSLSQKQVDNWWTGGGAKEYKDVLRPQMVAIKAIGTSAEATAKVLADFAKIVVTHWTSIEKEFVDTYTQMSKDAASIASPEIVKGIAGLVVDLAAAVNRVVMGFVNKFAEFESAAKGLETVANDSDAYPGGHWPRPGGNLDGTWTQEAVG